MINATIPSWKVKIIYYIYLPIIFTVSTQQVASLKHVYNSGHQPKFEKSFTLHCVQTRDQTNYDSNIL